MHIWVISVKVQKENTFVLTIQLYNILLIWWTFRMVLKGQTVRIDGNLFIFEILNALEALVYLLEFLSHFQLFFDFK